MVFFNFRQIPTVLILYDHYRYLVQVIIGDHEGTANILGQMQEEGAHGEAGEEEGGIIQVCLEIRIKNFS